MTVNASTLLHAAFAGIQSPALPSEIAAADSERIFRIMLRKGKERDICFVSTLS